ncbi:MAG TPA: hypothetical protein VHX60_02730 [Acidobacteriaceae bacterium]|jgi:hypothetical protein|nr:hypothetical protein [Acidobacteriaceae bacterium]
MRSLLRNFFFAPAVVAAAALATSSAMAATSVNIPFNFTVAGKTLPAGQYQVEPGPMGNTVRLTSNDSAHNFVWAVTPGSPEPTDQRTILTFDTFDQGHALRTVQIGSRITSRLDRARREYTPTRVMAGE